MLAVLSAGGAGCGGCAWDTGTGGEREDLGFVLRTGPSCAHGCAVDRPFMVGTEERIELAGETIVDVAVRTTNPGIATAWLEESALCCVQDTCHVLEPASPCTESQRAEVRTVVLRALAPGQTRVVVERRNGQVVDELAIQVAHPARVLAVPGAWELPTSGTGQGLTIQAEPTPMGRPITSLTLQMGIARAIRLEVLDAGQNPVFSSSGVGIRVVHPEIAVVTPEAELELGTGLRSLSEDHALIVPRRVGRTSLVVAAGSATASISLAVLPTGPRPPIGVPNPATDVQPGS